MKWLLLRGLAREQKHWLGFAAQLEQKGETVLLLDLPGVGTESSKKCPISISGNTDDVRERFLKIKGDSDEIWGILGVSMGGMVALDWAYRFPYDFNRIAVVNSSSKDTGPVWQRFTIFGLYQYIRTLAQKNPRKREMEILKMISNLKSSDEATITAMVDIATASRITATQAGRQLIASSQFMLPPKIKIPVLLMASLKDNLVDVRCSRLMADRLGAQIKFHPTAGHDLALDDPEWCIDKLMEFKSFERTHDGPEKISPRRFETDPT